MLDTMTVDVARRDALFRANGSKVKFPGFMKVYVEGSDDDSRQKKKSFCRRLRKARRSEPKQMEPKQHFTQPPPRYTEARLVKTLEETGIGRSEHVRADAGDDPEARIRRRWKTKSSFRPNSASSSSS